MQLLLRSHVHQDEPRPTMQSHGAYVFGVFLSATYVESQGEVFYPEVDLVITHDTIMTVRKTPVDHCPAFVMNSILSCSLARSSMICEARNSSRRWTIETLNP
jgi:hypothetical protein